MAAVAALGQRKKRKCKQGRNKDQAIKKEMKLTVIVYYVISAIGVLNGVAQAVLVYYLTCLQTKTDWLWCLQCRIGNPGNRRKRTTQKEVMVEKETIKERSRNVEC